MKSVDISGMGGGYEDTCQAMLIAGKKWLAKHPEFSFDDYKSYKNVVGVVIPPDTELAKELDKVLSKAALGDMTGAQHQAVISHLAYIHNNDEEKWIQELRNGGREIIEVNEKDIKKRLKKWEAKLASGYNPMKEMLSNIPKENIINYNPDNPDEAIKKLMELIDKAG
jgi:hypothetical protein